MLTENEEAQLDFALEDLRKEFLDIVRTDDADLLEYITAYTHRDLQRLITEITARKWRFGSVQ